MAILYHLDEFLMNASILRQFRMEGCGQNLALTYQHRITTDSSEDLYRLSCADYFRRSNKDYFERLLPKLAGSFTNGTVDLASVGITPDSYVHSIQGFLWRVLNVFRQQDSAGACTERWLG